MRSAGSRRSATASSTSPAADSWSAACSREGLVDDLHLFVYPISLGEGERFWAEGEQHKLTLKAHDVYDNGVVHLNYGPA